MVENAEAPANNEPFNWPPLESNPEIFTNYMQRVGLPARWSFGEIYGFDEDLLGMVEQPCLAVIINAEILNKQEDRAKGDLAVANQYYMK